MTLYLSRLSINPRSRLAQRDLSDCQQLHKTLLSVFPDRGGAARQEYGFLYRVDLLHGRPVVLTQSAIAPSWDELPSGYLLDAPRSRDVQGVYARLRQDQRLRFRLRANPTKRIGHETSANGKCWDGRRVQLFREEEQMSWLRRKADGGGFGLAEVRLHPGVAKVQAAAEAKCIGYRDKRRISFGSVLFDGELTIVDVDLFQRTLQTGIGSGKAYGFGLLSIAPQTAGP